MIATTSRRFIREDSLSLALFGLFLLSLVGEGVSGWLAYDGSLRASHLPPVRLGAYLGTGNFLGGIFSNLEAAILQLAVLITFSSVLRQKGAAHSRKDGAGSHRRLSWNLAP